MSRPETAGFREFAALAGFKPSYVTELRKVGRLVLTGDGKRVRVAESLALIEQTRDPAKAGVAARHAATRAAAASTTTPSPAGDDSDAQDPPVDVTDPVQASHAGRRAKALADKAETDAKAADRDYRISLGELLEAAQVEQAARSAAVTFRGALENLPNTLAPQLSAMTDEGRIRVVLSEAFEHALEELARKFAGIARTEAA